MVELWNRFDLFYDHHDHPDSYRFADLDGDGQLEIVSSHSEVGVIAGAMIISSSLENGGGPTRPVAGG